jgi:hypothetical protein
MSSSWAVKPWQAGIEVPAKGASPIFFAAVTLNSGGYSLVKARHG